MKEEHKEISMSKLTLALSELSKNQCDSVDLGDIIVNRTLDFVIEMLSEVRRRRSPRYDDPLGLRD